jgi:energy-coupling factor transporter ATP-binding protein EcfA2
MRLADLRIPKSVVMDLILRHLHLDGMTSLEVTSRTIKVSIPILDLLFRELRQQHLVEVKGSVGEDYAFILTSAGRELASERFRICRYVGPAPISIRDYHLATKAQSASIDIDRNLLRDALSDLVLSDRMLDQLGPAVISQRSLFLYGPSGNGKTSLAERLLRIYRDSILIPHAVEVDGKIIVLYDPVVHQTIDREDAELDPRWVPCKRPFIMVGGELVASMLELHYDEAGGVFAAPMQMKANNGIFLIDDFGRQVLSPRELLNRWIVPLDRRVDYLTLSYGIKFQIPFEMMVVFSTNLNPDDLADATFLRRIQNKVFVEPVDVPTFNEIWRRVAIMKKLPYDPEIVDYVRSLVLSDGRSELRACYPLDLCNIIVSISEYEKRPPQMTRDDLQRAVNLYFTQSYQKNTIDHAW